MHPATRTSARISRLPRPPASFARPPLPVHRCPLSPRPLAFAAPAALCAAAPAAPPPAPAGARRRRRVAGGTARDRRPLGVVPLANPPLAAGALRALRRSECRTAHRVRSHLLDLPHRMPSPLALLPRSHGPHAHPRESTDPPTHARTHARTRSPRLAGAPTRSTCSSPSRRSQTSTHKRAARPRTCPWRWRVSSQRMLLCRPRRGKSSRTKARRQ